MDHSTLNEIINGCKAGKRSSQEALFNEFSNELFGVCLYYSGNREDAEDALHEGFLKIFDKIKGFKGSGSFRGWIRKVMVNTVLEKHRKRNYLYAVKSEIKEKGEEFRDGISEDLNSRDLVHLIQQLSPQYRMVFNLYAIEGYSHKEIAKLLGISVGTSKSNLARARSILQKKVKKYFYTPVKKVE